MIFMVIVLLCHSDADENLERHSKDVIPEQCVDVRMQECEDRTLTRPKREDDWKQRLIKIK